MFEKKVCHAKNEITSLSVMVGPDSPQFTNRKTMAKKGTKRFVSLIILVISRLVVVN